jgi:peroxiredoxin Q/BCP
VGVSADKPESQVKFIDKYGLTYPMVSDTAKQVIGAYGARAVLGLAAKRSTYLIDPEGRVAHVWPDVKIGGHAEDVVTTIRELSAR